MPSARFALPARFRNLLARLRGLLGLGGDGQQIDPDAGVRAPRAGRPGGRSSAVALEEPDDPPPTLAGGRSVR